MPKLKPVASLQTVAMDVFFESVMQCCNRLSDMGDEGLLRSGVIAIRKEVCSRLPGPFLVEFADRFLANFSLKSRSQLHYEAALEMVMDVEIFGLRLRGLNLQYLDLEKGHRFRRFVELDLSPVILKNGAPMFCFLHQYHLDDLVTFIYPQFCTDDDLRIIGKNCPKLEVVKVTNSGYVTDQGLRALHPCSNLRVVYFRDCRKVSHIGLNNLLSAHDKLEDFYYWYDNDCNFYMPHTDCEIDPSSGLDLSAESPSVNRLVIKSYWNGRPALNLQTVVKKFPNLNYLKINCEDTVNLSVLKYQNKLTGLEINYVNGMTEYGEPELSETWDCIVEISRSIGSNITTLTLCALRQHFICTQVELDLIYNGFPNLENLDFDHVSGVLVVPEFKKLKVLTPRAPSELTRARERYNLEFGRMLNLEVLTLPYIGFDSKRIKSIMLDHDRFPKLSVLRISTWRLRDDVLPEIERIAKDNNIDFRVNIRDETPRFDDYPESSSEYFQSDFNESYNSSNSDDD